MTSDGPSVVDEGCCGITENIQNGESSDRTRRAWYVQQLRTHLLSISNSGISLMAVIVGESMVIIDLVSLFLNKYFLNQHCLSAPSFIIPSKYAIESILFLFFFHFPIKVIPDLPYSDGDL